MLFAALFFIFLSIVFSCQRVRWLLAGEADLSQKEKRISSLFGHYLRGAAVLLLLLWGLKTYSIPYLYQGAGILFLAITGLFLINMGMILKIQL